MVGLTQYITLLGLVAASLSGAAARDASSDAAVVVERDSVVAVTTQFTTISETAKPTSTAAATSSGGQSTAKPGGVGVQATIGFGVSSSGASDMLPRSNGLGYVMAGVGGLIGAVAYIL
jgi:hypothetical protein